MNAFPITEAVLGPVAWALLHFLWQGAVVALAAGLALTALRGRSAGARYLTACAGLATMALLPAATAFYLGEPAATPAVPTERAAAIDEAPAASPAASPSERALRPRWLEDRVEPLLPWLVALWMAGVTALSLAHLGGWRRVRRLRRATRPAAARWETAIARLARRLEISRPVRLLESARLRVPVVVGWLRPAILVPASAFAGLAPHQLEAVLAHELAHVRRHDYLVNLIQIAVETLLFYHPGVWWLSRQVRAERENCCDDLAVEVCGSPVVYARALAELEDLRFGTPALALGADGGSLLGRVRRLLGTDAAPRVNGWLTAALAALMAVLVAAAGTALVFVASSSEAAPLPDTPAEEEAVEAPAWAEGWMAGAEEAPAWNEGWTAAAEETPAWAEGWAVAQTGAAFELAQAAEEEPAREKDSRRERRWHRHDDDDDWIEEEVQDLRRAAAGTPYEASLGDEDFREMARHGCDEDLIPALAGAGATAAATDDLVRLCRHGVDGDDIREYAAAGFDVASTDNLLKLARQGVDGDDVRGFHDAGYELSADELVQLARHGIDGHDVQELRQAGFRELSVDELTRLARNGIDGDDLTEFTAAGLKGLSIDDLVTLARNGVDGNDVEEFVEAGYRDLSVDDLVSLARNGVDGNDVEEFVDAGYRDLSVDDLVTLARNGVDGDDAGDFLKAGYPGLSVDQLVDLARNGVDADDLVELRKAGHDLSIDEVLRLARSGELHEMMDRHDDD